MAYIIGIETGTDICSVSLSQDGTELAVKESGSGNDHARTLAVLIDQILKDNGLEPGALSAVVVSSGPGSYTGLRIGVSTAKGLCYGLGIPLIAVGSLLSLARVAAQRHCDMVEGALLCPMIDARRMEVYAQVFDGSLNPVSGVGAHIIDRDSFSGYLEGSARFLIFGNGAAKCREILISPKIEYLEVRPSASGLIEPGWGKFYKEEFEDPAYFEPFYLKDFIVTTSRKRVL